MCSTLEYYLLSKVRALYKKYDSCQTKNKEFLIYHLLQVVYAIFFLKIIAPSIAESATRTARYPGPVCTLDTCL